MPWSRQDTNETSPDVSWQTRVYAIFLLCLVPVCLFLTVVDFVTGDCLEDYDSSALSSCPKALEHVWLPPGLRLDVLQQLAWAQVEFQEYEDAIVTYREMETHGPLDWGGLWTRAHARFYTNNGEGAMADLDEALKRQPDEADLLADYSHFANELGKPDIAKPMLEKLVAEAPDDFDKVLSLSWTEIYSGNFAKARELAAKTIGKTKSDVLAHYVLAYAYNAEANWTEALKNADKCLAIDTYFRRCWEMKARTLVSQGLWHDAVRISNNGLDLLQTEGSLYASKAYAHWALEEFEEANSDYEKAIELTPGLTWIAEEHAHFLISMGDPKKADAAIAKLRTGYSSKSAITRAEAFKAQIAADYVTAINLYDQAFQESNQQFWLLADKSSAMVLNGEYLPAIAACDEMLVLAPQEPESERCKAKAYRAMGNYEHALLADERALKIRPGYAPAEFDKAYDLIVLRRRDEALLALNTVIQKNYQPGVSYQYRAMLLLEDNQKALARKDFEKALNYASTKTAVHISQALNQLSSEAPTLDSMDIGISPQSLRRSRW
jgi:tetratricopeptide (TPR) repeat protein